MKYIKFFEQFDNEEDSWWEEESPFDLVKDLRIIQNSGRFYLLKEIRPDGHVVLFDDNSAYPKSLFNLNIKFDKNHDLISICYSSTIKKYLYEDLPTEIKNRIII